MPCMLTQVCFQGRFVPYNTALNHVEVCKEYDLTGRINHYCLSCRRTLLSRCGPAAGLTGNELVWSSLKELPLPWMSLRDRAVLLTPDSVTPLMVRSTWITSMLTRNGRLKDRPPHFGELERGSVCQPDWPAILPSRRAALRVSQAARDDVIHSVGIYGATAVCWAPKQLLGKQKDLTYSTSLWKEHSRSAPPHPVCLPPSPPKPQKSAPPPTSPDSHLCLFPTLLSLH